jgi:hypothetical protein
MSAAATWSSPHFSPPPPNVHVLSVPDTLPEDDPENPPEVVGLREASGG